MLNNKATTPINLLKKEQNVKLHKKVKNTIQEQNMGWCNKRGLA